MSWSRRPTWCRCRCRCRCRWGHLVQGQLEAGHVGVEHGPEAPGHQQVGEQGEGLLLVAVHEEEGGGEGEALAVAHLGVQQAVGLQEVVEAELAGAEGAPEVGVGGEGAPQVDQDGVLVGGDYFDGFLTGHFILMLMLMLMFQDQ